MKLPWLYRFEKSERVAKWIIGGYAALTVLFFLMERDTLMLLSLMGALYEAALFEIRKLRSEVRRKRLWNEGV